MNDSVTDVFVYTIQDDATTPATASATLTITILGANDTSVDIPILWTKINQNWQDVMTLIDPDD